MGGLDQDEVLWPPHWTCCRGEWESEGCKQTWHHGPLLEDYKQNPRKFEYPDPRTQIYFKKSCSFLWQKKLEDQYTYDEETLLRKLKKIAIDDGVGGVTNLLIIHIENKNRHPS